MDDDPAAPELHDRIQAALALQLVAASTGVPVEQMANTRNKGRSCRARWVAMYLAHVTFGWPIERVGHAFGMNRATAALACRWGEEARDRPGLNEMLERLEDCVRRIIDAPRYELSA